MPRKFASNTHFAFSPSHACRHLSPLIFFLLLTGSLLAAYSNTLQSPFIFDDFPNIVDNVFIRMDAFSWENIRNVLTAQHPNSRRNFVYLSFALNYLWDGYQPFTYHLVNILIHIGCSLLLLLFFYKTLKSPKLKDKYGAAAFPLAWAAALLWGLHPLQINAVTYIVQRMTAMALLFALISLISWLYGREYAIRKLYAQKLFFYCISFLFWMLSMMCKEHTAILPLLIILHELLLLRDRPLKISRQWIFLGMICAAGLFLLMLPFLKGILAAYRHRDFTLWERLMTQGRVLWHYVSLFYFPLPDRFVLLHDYPVSQSLIRPVTTLCSFLGWTAIVMIAWFRRKTWPVFAWTTAWFLAAHLIESTIIPLEIIFEHRMYLPSVALSLGTVLIFYDAALQKTDNFCIFLSIFCLFLLCSGYATWQRNADFRSRVDLYQTDLEKYPGSRRMRHNLALALNRRGDTAKGGAILEKLSREYPEDIPVQQSYFLFLAIIKKNMTGAETVYQHVERLLKEDKFTHYTDAKYVYQMARFFHDRGLHERALFLVNYLMAYQKNTELLFLQGRCHIGRGDWHSSLDSFRKAWEKEPESQAIMYWFAQSLIQTGEKEKGCALLQKSAQGSSDKRAAARSMHLFTQVCKDPDKVP
ncbi:MAG: CDC27 family protein [Desulfococcaceae bacterium]|jgi:Flp pilus assembly protein TadD|nr:CDC27 family protein [Desulfococcaceae bacterium]